MVGCLQINLNDKARKMSAADTKLIGDQTIEIVRLRLQVERLAAVMQEVDDALDRQLYDDQFVKSCRDNDLDIPADCEHHVIITEKLRAKIRCAAIGFE